MRKCIVALLALAAFAVPGSALAQDDPPNPPDTQPAAPALLPAPAPPTTPVTDEDGAGVFAKAFLIAHAGDLIPGSHAIDVNVAACRQVDSVARFYCLATARVVRVQRIVIIRHVLIRGHNRGRAAGNDPPPNDGRDNRHNNRHRVVRIVIFRVQLWNCVAVVRVVGGPTVTPTATLPVRDCVRVQRGPTAEPVT